MSENKTIAPETIAQRCFLTTADYSKLTDVDWCVLDFTDGKRSFEEIASILPTDRESIASSYSHLQSLGLVTWRSAAVHKDEQSPIFLTDLSADFSSDLLGALKSPMSSTSESAIRTDETDILNQIIGCLGSSSDGASVEVDEAPHFAGYDDATCRQYLPERLISVFRQYSPRHYDTKLEISGEMQAFAEFIHVHLSELTPYELLGIAEGTTDESVIRQGYATRSKQFHPELYFRKKIGPFAEILSDIFKAMTSAHHELQPS